LKPGLAFPPTSAGHGIIGRIDQAPDNGLSRGQPEGITSLHNQANLHNKNVAGWQKNDFSKSMPTAKSALMRPKSAMAQLPSESRSKHDLVTAKVRPMVATPSPDMPGYYFGKTAPPSTSSGGVNIFAYKPPPSQVQTDQLSFSHSNITVLPSGNIKYTQAFNPPPPYPGSGYYGGSDLSGRSFHPAITVDFEALRRKLAHAPRPLKKRSSITEPERPQGPVISKLLYDQLYKKADTPFYRQSSDYRSTPPPAYIEPPKLDVGESPAKKEAEMPDENVATASENEPKLIPSDDDNEEDDDVSSEEGEDIDDAFPPPPLPSLSAVPTKGILK